MTRTFPRAAALALIAGAAAAAGCSKPQTPASAAADSATTPSNFTLSESQRSRLQLVPVALQSFHPEIEATGTVAFNGDRSTQVLSPVSGPAVRIAAEPGAIVQRGTPLAYVSSPDFASAVADYRKAQSAYRNAQRIEARDSALFKNDALARADLEQAQTDLSGAEADVEAAVQAMRALGVDEAQINAVQQGSSAPIQAIIRSPIAGTVVEKLITPGQLLEAGSTPCFTVADLSTMWVMTSVFPNDLRNVSVGQPASIMTDASPTPIQGRVDYVAALVDPSSKAVSVRVLAPNTRGILRRDMFVRVQIRSGAPHDGVLVPTAAVLRNEENLPFVFVTAKSGRGFERRRVELGSRVGDQYEIPAGLAVGDTVVGNGALFLQFAESQ
jgi:cobalt-zinc-cadmium efflux system membrane fusion protein